MKYKASIPVTLAVVLSMFANVVLAAPPMVGNVPSSGQPVSLADPVAAAEPSAPAGDVPADWWSAVQEDIRRSEYNVTWQEGGALAGVSAGYQAPNRAQNLRTWFTPEGIRVTPRVFEGAAPPWEWGLALAGYGSDQATQPGEAATVTVEGNRIEYARGAVSEWYVNDARGLAQGFMLHSSPATGGQGVGSTLALDLKLSGGLHASLTAAGDALELTTPGGVRVLRYTLASATDAAGRTLPARLLLPSLPTSSVDEPQRVQVLIDAQDAVYPISVEMLTATPSWTAESDQNYANFGRSVGTAGDVNGDGYNDVIVGAPSYDGGYVDEGRAFVYHGGATGLSMTAAWTAEGDQNYAFFGYSVGTAGDVNGDDYDDVIVGAHRYDGGQIDEGRAFVYHGNGSGLSITANWMAEGDQTSANFGWSVGTAGDVNGDGYDDVIVGAYGYDSGEFDEGRAFVYHGSVSGLGVPAWTAEGDQLFVGFGYSVGSAGDVNGDGYADVIVGAPYYTNGQIQEGRAFVYHGSLAGLGGTAWTAEGDQTGGNFGFSVGTAGDVNGDGYADVIVGAPNYDNGQIQEGGAFVYHGGATGLSMTAAWTAESAQVDANFGYSVGTAGDVNGDGYADVIVGAPTYDNGQSDEGRAFVYHGGATGLSMTVAWTAEGDQAVASFGYSVGTTGDVNGDGYADVIVGARNYDNGQADEGRAFVYYGSVAGLGGTAEGDQDSANFGWSVGTAGDVNGDGYADVIVGAPYYDNGQTDEGRAFVYHGSMEGLGATVAWTDEGDQDGANFGVSVGTAGDVNGDGYADVIVGAPFYDSGQTDGGRALVYHGGAGGLGWTAAWTVEGDQADARFGSSVGTAGDVKGDGYADVIVGAPSYDSGETNEGRAFVYRGGVGGLALAADWTAESNQANALFGYSVGTAGDVNGDGYADVIVGAYFYSDGQTGEGGAFVYHGDAAGLGGTAAWTVEGDQTTAAFGSSVGTAGDVNGDGYADVIVGAPYYDNGQTNEGRAFVYHGDTGGLNTTAAWTVEGDQASAYLGYSVGTAGDVNGDGYADVIVGAYGYDNGQSDEGRALVYHGGATVLGAAAAWAAEGAQTSAWFGVSVRTAGDVNGDGYAEVIVGAPFYDNGQTNEGRAFVRHGSAAGLSAAAAWITEGDQTGAQLGWSVGTAGDVNGDGYADVIVGAPYYDNGQTDEGRAFVYHGSAAGLSMTAAWTAESDQTSANFGWSVGSAGDVNGDGYADVIVGARYYSNGQSNEGRAFVYHGGAAVLSATAAWTAESDQAGAYFGWSVGTAGDVNGDGYADVIVGALYYDNSQTDEGHAFVYHGSAAGLSMTAAWTAESDQASAYFGYSVRTAGDVNGDGYADVIVGARNYDNGQTDEGRAFVYHGGAAGLGVTAAWTAESDQTSANFGWSVGSAGDVNGDGYADVIAGARNYDNGQSDEGRAFVYHGGAAGLSATAAWTAESDQAGAYFGWSVGTAGDVNGDGYADVIVGAIYYDNGEFEEGRAFVYHGGAAGLNAAPYWTAESDQSAAYLGASAGTAGDVNGDGYADVIVGANYYSNGQTNEGRALVYYGNGGAGLAVRPQQRRADDTAPVAPGGQVISPNAVRLAALLRTPFGRSDVAVQWEVKPEGSAFDGSGLGQSAWMDSGVAGASLSQLVSGLGFETRNHWRVRILGRPRGAATSSVVAYRSRWIYGAAFLTALSGQQAIGGTGQTNLLGQTPYVDISNLGAPALTSLALMGYPNTEPPNASSFPGYGAGTAILDRYFSLAPNSGAAGYELALCLNYDDSEVAAAGAIESALRLCRWTGSAWQCPPRAAGSDTGANLVCAEGVSAFSNWAIASGDPLAVTLAGFSAQQQGDAVLAMWETTSELGNSGFNLHRGLTPDGPDRQVNATLIPSQSPGSPNGFTYTWLDDADLTPGATYYYWLEDVDLSGATTLHGPVSVDFTVPTAVELSGLAADSPGARSPWLWAGLAVALVAAVAWTVRRRRPARRAAS